MLPTIFRYAVRSGDQQLADAAYNSLCGDWSAGMMNNVAVSENSLIGMASTIGQLIAGHRASKRKIQELAEENDRLRRSQDWQPPEPSERVHSPVLFLSRNG